MPRKGHRFQEFDKLISIESRDSHCSHFNLPCSSECVSGDTILKVKLDLSNLQQGNYNLGVRRARFDWGIHPVVVR